MNSYSSITLLLQSYVILPEVEYWSGLSAKASAKADGVVEKAKAMNQDYLLLPGFLIKKN